MLVVEDFGVKYIGKEHANQIILVLKEHCELSEDWGGTKYCEVVFNWDYEKREVHLSIPDYVKKALVRFQHQLQEKPEHQLYEHAIPAYGSKIQHAKGTVELPLLNKE